MIKAKRSKKYKPRPGIPIVFGLSKEHADMLKLVPHIELEKLHSQLGDEHTFHNMALRLNLGSVLSYSYHADIEQSIVELGMAALREVLDRHARVGKYGCNTGEFTALGAALNLTDTMQSERTRSELRDALNEVMRRAAR